VIQTGKREFEIDDLASVHELSTVVGNIPIIFHEAKINQDQLELRVGMPQSATASQQWQNISMQLQNRLQILDGRGTPLDHRGTSQMMNGRSVEWVLQYAANNQDHSRRAKRLQWTIPTDSRELVVPIRFDNIPLFDDNN